MTRLGPLPAYLRAPIPETLPRMRTAGRVCPSCKRVLIPSREGTWPPHYKGDPALREWCKKTDQPVKGWRA